MTSPPQAPVEGQVSTRSSRTRTAVWAAGLLEVLLAAVYIPQDAVYHWLVHLLSGGAAGLLLTTAALLLVPHRLHAPAGQLAVMAVAGGHLLAAIPDVLFALGHPHRPWMNLFIGHLAAHSAPGGTWGLLVLFLAALASYLIVTTARAKA